jgi:hypothetical protein
METTGYSSQAETPEPDQSQPEDWLAGATVAAQAQGISLGQIDVSLDGLGLPEPEGPDVA